MVNMQESQREPIPAVNLTTASQEELRAIISQHQLHMTVRDLRYCQNQYRMRERRDPTVEELLMLDALYKQRIQRNEMHGLRSFYTSDPLVAQTYADLIAKASHLRRDDRPYTPAELSGVLTHSLRQAGKKISVPHLCAGQHAPLHLLGQRVKTDFGIMLGECSAYIGQSADRPAEDMPSPKPTDNLILITPSSLTAAAFAEVFGSLSIPPNAQIVPISAQGLLEALLTWDGVYIVEDYLPYPTTSRTLSSLVTSFQNSILIRVDGSLALPLRDAAAAAGLVASIIGKIAINHRLTVRREGQAPLQIETAFLKAFSPMLPIDTEIPGSCMAERDTLTPSNAQTVADGGNCALFSSAVQGTPYALSEQHLLTGAYSHPCDNTFRSALLATAHAVNRAVAAGADYNDLTISNLMSIPAYGPAEVMGEMMAALLGSYRLQAELAIPDVGGRFTSASKEDERVHMTVFAAAPKPTEVIPYTFAGAGNNIYLLTPLASEHSPIDFDDYRKLLRYVHHLCQDGIALSAIAIDSCGMEAGLHTMTQGGYGCSILSPLPTATCGFLIETNQVIQGVLLGLTTASPTMQCGQRETPIVSYRLPNLPVDRIPMSPIGTAHPIVCMPLTRALGPTAPVKHWVESHHAILRTTTLNRPTSRTQLTELANALTEANLGILVGTGEEIAAILGNRRVEYAKKTMLSRGGLLLCLHTDLTTVKNELIPWDHPLFFGLPAAMYDRASISFEDDGKQIVHMRADSFAIRQMLSCGIAYYK